MRRDELFERLDPPPGGLAMLRRRLDGRPRRTTGALVPLAAALALAALVLLAIGRRRPPDLAAAASARAGTAEVALGLAPAPASVVTLTAEARATAALAEVRTSNPEVSFYWVSSTGWGEKAAPLR